MKITIKMALIFTLFAVITSCSHMKQRKPKHTTATINDPKAPHRLVTFMSERCLITPKSKYTKESVLGSLILASLAKTAINTTFTAINDYATKKATADSEGKTFVANNNGFVYKGALLRPVDDKPANFAIKTSLNMGCISILKESKKAITESKWKEAFVRKLSIPEKDINELLSENSIDNAPDFFFQANIIFHKDFGVYEIKPALLNYMSSLGGSKVSDGKDLAIIVEVSEPGKADKPALQFSYDFKDVNATELYTEYHLTPYGSMFYTMVPYNQEFTATLAKIDAINTSFDQRQRFIKNTNLTLTDTDTSIATLKCDNGGDAKKCKALKDTKASLTEQIKVARRELAEIVKQRANLKKSIGTKPKLASPVNIKASVTEVGDVNKFWEVVAKFTGTLQEDVKTYATAKFNRITDTYTEAEKITDSNEEFGYQIALANFDITLTALKNAKDEEKPAKYVACLTSLKSLHEAAIKVNQVPTQTCDI